MVLNSFWMYLDFFVACLGWCFDVFWIFFWGGEGGWYVDGVERDLSD